MDKDIKRNLEMMETQGEGHPNLILAESFGGMHVLGEVHLVSAPIFIMTVLLGE